MKNGAESFLELGYSYLLVPLLRDMPVSYVEVVLELEV